MVTVVPGKDVTVYIPADTPPEVITYLNRLKAEGNFSQGIMEILISHIVQHRREAEVSAFDDRNSSLDGIQSESYVGNDGSPGADYPSKSAPDRQSALSPEDIIRLATRNAGKLLNARANRD
jgi:hypothetical protein